jgi:hypothetical protein
MKRKSINEIAEEDGVTPEEVEAGIADVEGMLSMIAGDSEITDDALPRITTCPLCGGTVAFSPLSFFDDFPRVNFTPDTTWGCVKREWREYVLSIFQKAAEEQGIVLSESQKIGIELRTGVSALILECHECGKGFDPRS